MLEQDAATSITSPADPVPAEFDLLCEGCGYSLVGLVDSNRCPECGEFFDPNELPLARVPWLYRVRLGAMRAYWRTVGYVLTNPSGFATELCRPVRISASDAAAFRRRTIRIAIVSATIPLFFVQIFIIRDLMIRGFAPGNPYTQRCLFRAGGAMVLFYLVAKTLFTLGTDLPTFIWRGISEKTHELAPLHHYASAPLALMPLFAMVTVLAAVAELFVSGGDNFVWARYCIAGTAIIQLTLMTWLAALLMRAATHCSGSRQAALAVYLVLHWVLAAFLGLMVAATVFAILWATLGPEFRW